MPMNVLPLKKALPFCLCLVFLCASGLVFAQDFTLNSLRCEYQNNPVGLDETAPRLCWKIQSDQRGFKQSAYRILVASSEALLAEDKGDLWDSGKMASDQSVHIAYAGTPLTSRAQCFWKAMIWDAQDAPSAWSTHARWSMGFLEASDWQAQWIGLDRQAPEKEEVPIAANWIWHTDEAPASSAPVGKRYFRHRFEIPSDATIDKATLFMAGDNSYSFSINGKKAGDGSGWFTFTEAKATKLLQPGNNVISATVTNDGEKPNPAGLIAALSIHLGNGEEVMIRTGEAWRSSAKRDRGWEKADFDGELWNRVTVLGENGIAPWGEVAQKGDGKRRLPARYLRKEFTAKKGLRSARAYISGLGYYKLFLNEKRVGDHELDPILRDYDKQTPYLCYELEDLLQEGENAVAVMLGSGRFHAPHLTVPTKTRDFGLPQLIFQLELDYEDGEKEVLISDESWRITDKGPIRKNNDYDGEYYDATMEMPGWMKSGYDASSWDLAQAVEAPKGALRSAALMEPMRVTGTLKPISLNEAEPGMWVFDMGQNMVGRCRLLVEGPAGTVVKMHFAENIYPDGTLDFRNLRAAECTDHYVLKGEGVESYTPSFTYHGFRYVEVTGFPGTPTLETLHGEIINTDMAFSGDFTCSKETINQILKNARWGIRGNYLSIPTDCPQRDERQGWQGDRGGEQLGEAYLFENILLYEKWMGDVRDSQTEEGNLSDVCPNFWPLYNANVTWPSSFVIIPGNIYRHYGDTRAIERNYPFMMRWMNFMRSFVEDGIIAKDNYGDWCCPPESKDLIHSKQSWRKTPKELLATAYYYHNLNLLADYADLLKKPEEATALREEAKGIYTAFNEKLYDTENQCYGNGSQTSQVLPLRFGLIPEERRQATMDYIINHIETKTGGHIGTGLIGGQWLMRTLSDYGHIDMAYRFATQRDYPSWGYMIENGATTIWELWNGNTANPAMNSGNHVMLLGDVLTWFMEYLGGIRSDAAKPGFKHIVMKPQIVGDLTHAQASHESQYGKIESDWKIDGKTFHWKVSVPPNTEATVYVPAQAADKVTESGGAAEKAPGVNFVGMESGKAVYTLGSGSYSFASSAF